MLPIIFCEIGTGDLFFKQYIFINKFESKENIMRKTIIATVMMMLSAFFITTAQADIRPGSYTVTPFIGGFIFEGNEYYRGFDNQKNGRNTLDDTYAVGLRAGYNFTENLGLEGFFSYIPTSRDNFICCDRKKDNDLDLYYYGIEGLYHFLPYGRLVPFVAVGLGGIRYDAPSGEDDGNKFAVDYGAGIKYSVTDKIDLRADVRHVLPLNERYNDLLYSFGVTFSFGGAEKGKKLLDIKFDFDKTDIKAAYHKDINAVTKLMQKYPDLNIVTEGHTDNIGTPEYNKNLSNKRADAVKKYMVEKGGVAAGRIDPKGLGEGSPAVSNDTEAGRAENRRVEAAVDYTGKK